jgi:hypothetical protein
MRRLAQITINIQGENPRHKGSGEQWKANRREHDEAQMAECHERLAELVAELQRLAPDAELSVFDIWRGQQIVPPNTS